MYPLHQGTDKKDHTRKRKQLGAWLLVTGAVFAWNISGPCGTFGIANNDTTCILKQKRNGASDAQLLVFVSVCGSRTGSRRWGGTPAGRWLVCFANLSLGPPRGAPRRLERSLFVKSDWRHASASRHENFTEQRVAVTLQTASFDWSGGVPRNVEG